MALINTKKGTAMGNDTKYSRAIKVPHYEPSDTKPLLGELYNSTKYSKLIGEINKSNVSEEEKQFLRLAASRHIVFNYAKIADYYAHSSKEMQELMESNALVVIDVDDAIANGYIKMSARMQQLVKESKEFRAKEKDHDSK